MSADFSPEWERLSEAERNLIVAAQAQLPVKLGEIARKLGLEVKVTTLEIGISGEIGPNLDAPGSFKIRINKHEVKTRQRFTLSHEISHFLLHRDLIGGGIIDNILFRSRLSNAIEAEANRLAADILMPKSEIRAWKLENAEIGKTDCVVPLASLFGVSEDAVRIRIGLK
ncbi:MAG: ImmA/IrrE family metallo-endopeptidase [Mesorhizobium sp.]